ncbi:hypothetical protein GCM10007338_00340 [Corynebacterium pelargi]|nr:hypothetical protein GCM10007338_00340 [Corynebacterium pelargi]
MQSRGCCGPANYELAGSFSTPSAADLLRRLVTGSAHIWPSPSAETDSNRGRGALGIGVEMKRTAPGLAIIDLEEALLSIKKGAVCRR